MNRWYRLRDGRLGSQAAWFYPVTPDMALVCFESGPSSWCAIACIGGESPINLDAKRSGAIPLLVAWNGACIEWGINEHKRGRLSKDVLRLKAYLGEWAAFEPG